MEDKTCSEENWWNCKNTNLMILDKGIQPEQLAQAINEIFIDIFGNYAYEENIVDCRKVIKKILTEAV